jgi:hypothetical protein
VKIGSARGGPRQRRRAGQVEGQGRQAHRAPAPGVRPQDSAGFAGPPSLIPGVADGAGETAPAPSRLVQRLAELAR